MRNRFQLVGSNFGSLAFRNNLSEIVWIMDALKNRNYAYGTLRVYDRLEQAWIMPI